MATFSNAQTLSQLAEQGIFIEIKENPKTKKLFMVDEAGNVLGGIAETLVPVIRKTGALDNNWIVSDFTPEDGETMKLLHVKGEGAPTIASSRPSVVAKSAKKAF
jgi:hypothetical protein